MKNTLLLFYFLTWILFISCKNGKKVDSTSIDSISTDTVIPAQVDSLSGILLEDSNAFQKKMWANASINATASQEIFYNESISVDSIIGNYQVSYTFKDNGELIFIRIDYDSETADTILYADRSVYLTLKNGKKTIVRKEINKYFFQKYFEDDIKKYELWSFEIERVSNDFIVFQIMNCIPDTDQCYTFHLSVSNSGIYSIELQDEGELDGGELGEEVALDENTITH